MNRFAARYAVPTDPLRTERRVELAVVVLAALLLVQMLWGAYRALVPAVPEPIMPAPASLQVAEVTDAAPVTPQAREELRQRPLFWSSRRPAEQPPGVAEGEALATDSSDTKPGKISGVKLVGVFGGGDSAGIIVQADGKKRRVMVGEKLNGWTLDAVTPIEAQFSDSGRQTSLQLERVKLVGVESAGNASASNDAAAEQKKSGGRVPDTLGLGGGDRLRGTTTK